MSRAFVREDVDPPERSGRRRSASGLPPGTVNYITPRGARRLRGELTKSAASGDSERVTELERILASVQIVDPPDNSTGNIGFGSTITVQEEGGSEKTYTVAGVDELAFEPDGISWISLLGKALLAAEIGSRIPLESGGMARVVKTAYRND